MTVTKSKIINCFLAGVVFLVFVIIIFVPFTNACNNIKDEKQFCKYQLAVYEFSFIESEGEGEPKSDTYIGNIILHKKVGGVLQYLGIEKLN